MNENGLMSVEEEEELMGEVDQKMIEKTIGHDEGRAKASQRKGINKNVNPQRAKLLENQYGGLIIEKPKH